MLKLLNKNHWFFVFVIIGQMLVYNYPYILKLEPRTIHAWRQFDCLSFAQNFYNNNATLLSPALNNLGHTGNGKSVSEFPIVPMIIGNIWKITGINSSIYKLANLIFLFLGLFYLYKLFILELNDKVVSTLLTGIIFTSPILSYYGVSTISDIQAFSFSIAGFYHFSSWLKNKKSNSLKTSVLLFLMAGLIKASSIILFTTCIIIYLIHECRNVIELFNSKLKLQIAFLLASPFFIWISWFLYARNYNLENNSEFFLVGILPIWDYDIAYIKSNFEKLFNNLLPELLNPAVFILLLIGLFYTLIYSDRKDHKLTISLCVLNFCGFIALFFGAMDVHDYYFISPFILLIISLLFISKNWYEKVKLNYYPFLLFSLILILLVNSYLTGIKTWKKINDNVNDSTDFMVFNEFQRKNNFWIYWLDREQFKTLEKMNIPMDKLGIDKNQKIFCLGDFTINRSLYLINRRGYSNFNVSIDKTPLFINEHSDIKFVLLINHTLKKDSLLQPILRNKIYEEDNLSIYKVN